MAVNLTGCNAGLVILVGDDPGAWGSQNEQDSRTLAMAAELPLLEPTTVTDAGVAMGQAFGLSETLGLPVIVRVTRALVLAQADAPAGSEGKAVAGFAQGAPLSAPPAFEREFMRWVVLPINVVPYHRRLVQRLGEVRGRFENSPLNGIEGEGAYGVIAVGDGYLKLVDALSGTVRPALRVLRLGTVHPLPSTLVASFLRTVEAAIVIEAGIPCVERTVKSLAQSEQLTLPIYGRESGHIPVVGELFVPHIAAALNRFMPPLALAEDGPSSRPMPSRQGLCNGCPYIPVFDALVGAMARHGGRDAFVIVGDPGCMVRAQLPPYRLLDVKSSLGSSIGTATGMALSVAKDGTGTRVVAICGDSALLHSGLNGLVDAARLGVAMTVLILDNGTTALSGGQPHPGSRLDARGVPQQAVDLAALVRAAGVDALQVVDVAQGDDISAALEGALGEDGLAAVVARGPCPVWATA
jgi:indolepyruvate ferredoxin oxidoreductase alpha subunit